MDISILDAKVLEHPLDITINWSRPVDLDLCVFYRTKDGRSGGVFSDEFRQNLDDLGTLDEFPFMLHHGDEKEPSINTRSAERVTVGSFEDLERLDVVVINYDDAVDMIDVDYNDGHGSCQLQAPDYMLEIPSAPTGNGQAYHVATINRRDDGTFAVESVNRTLTLSDAYYNIPGFELICE